MDTTRKGRTTWAAALDVPSAGRALVAIESAESEAGASGAADLPRIEGYIIDKRLGGGAGGEVFRGVRDGSDQVVAIKVLRQRLGESPSARRAWRELDMLAQLRLLAIPSLLDHGEHDGRLYLVTEFIDGVSLLEFAKRESLDLRTKVDLLSRVADALQSVHEFAVIHRDIKPENILINPHGQPVLVDLGIAMLLSRDVFETLTLDGSPIGTPAYMSPEQARGESRTISIRSDVYGLGATAYMLLTGHTPHAMDVTIHEAIRRVAHDPPRDPREIDPSLPKPLAAILHKAVAARPQVRYETVGAFAADLRRWLRGEHVEAAGTSFSQRVGRFIGRHPIATTAATCAVIALLSLTMTAASAWWLNMRPNALEIDPANRAWVRLLSHSGRELHRWDHGVVWFAQIVNRPTELGGGRIAVFSFGRSNDPRFSGQICAFDVSEPSTPLWVSGVGDAVFDMPAPISMNRGDAMETQWTIVQDVFPESPGVEIIAGHRLATFSAMCIRVYSLDGHVLYEVWHDGGTTDAYWMQHNRLLITCGYNSEAVWARRGITDDPATIRPIVLFAIKPEFATRYRQRMLKNIKDTATRRRDKGRSSRFFPVNHRRAFLRACANRRFSYRAATFELSTL